MVDMSPQAITARIREVSQLAQVCLGLSFAGSDEQEDPEVPEPRMLPVDEDPVE